VIKEALEKPLREFTGECNNLDSYQNLMKLMDTYIKSIGSRAFSKYRAYPNEHLISGIKRLLSILPIGDSEQHFLADFIDNLSFLISILVALETDGSIVDGLNDGVCKTLKKDIFPFLYEVGMELKDKREYIKSLLEIIRSIMHINNHYKHFVDYLVDEHFVEYLCNLDVYLTEDITIKRKLSQLMLVITGPRNSEIRGKCNTQSIVKNIVCALNAVEIGSNFNGTQLIHTNLFILQQLLKASKERRELKENKKSDEVSILAEYNSFGWLSRFLTHRHSKIKIKCWQLLCELVGTDLLLSQGSLLQDAVNTILRQSELYGIKIKAMDFLSCCLDYLMRQEEIGNTQSITLESVINIIRKSGLISRCKGFFVAKDVPLLFVATLLNLLKKVIIADYKNVLSVLTQIDFWTLLGDYLRVEEINRCNVNTGKRPIFGLSRKLTPKDDTTTFHICITSIIEFVIECIFRQTQLANHLLKSTKILQNTFSLFVYSSSIHNSKPMIFDTYVNRMFTLWTLFAEHEASTAKNILYDLLSNSKVQVITSGFDMCSTIDSSAAVSRFAAKLVETLDTSQLSLIESNSGSQRIMKKVFELYELTKSEEENNKDNLLYNQQKYDIVKSMTMFVYKSVGAKKVAYSDSYTKIIAKDLMHLASILYCALIETKPEATTKVKSDLIKTKKSVMLNKSIVQRKEILNVGCAREMLVLLLQFLKSLFCDSGELISQYKSIFYTNRIEGVVQIMNSLMIVYEQTAITDKELLISLLEVLCTLASQGQAAKELFLQKNARRCFIEVLIEIAQSFTVGADSDKIKKVFDILRSLSLSREIINYIWKCKFIDTILKKIIPLLKATQREFSEGCSLTLAFTKFLSAYAYHEDGRKFLQSHKALFEFYIDLLIKEPKPPTNIIKATLTLLRNAAFSKGIKLHFLSSPEYILNMT